MLDWNLVINKPSLLLCVMLHDASVLRRQQTKKTFTRHHAKFIHYTSLLFVTTSDR